MVKEGMSLDGLLLEAAASRRKRSTSAAPSEPAPEESKPLGPGANKGKIAVIVSEFAQDTTVSKDEETLKFSRKEISQNPDAFISALSPKEKFVLFKLPEDPNKEPSKVDFFTMTTDEREELYRKIKQGQVDFEREFKPVSGDKKSEEDKFFISDIRKMLQSGHNAKFLQTGDPKDKQQPIVLPPLS